MEHPHRKHRRKTLLHDRTSTILAIIFALVTILWFAEPSRGSTLRVRWSGVVTATWYGPGFYGHRTACGQTLTRYTRGVAHRTLRCGTRLQIMHAGRIVTVRVIDRGPYSYATLDLTARTAQDLCHCTRPYTMKVRYRRA